MSLRRPPSCRRAVRIATAFALAAAVVCVRAASAQSSNALASEFLTVWGQYANDAFGAAISGGGDFDGDGAADFAVGAYGYPNRTSFGRVAVYRGGAALDGVPDWSVSGTASNDLLGWSLSLAGDLNDDGHADLVVSAPYQSHNWTRSGEVRVYFGGASPDSVADLVISGDAVNANLGVRVVVPGDVNGDGADDLLVGAYNATSQRGTVSLFFGGASLDTVPDLVLHSTRAADNFGFAIAPAGDVNGDGFADFIVGERTWSAYTPTRSEGRARVYFGGAAPDTVADLVFAGIAQGQQLGVEVAGGGDFNGDGYADVFVRDASRDARALFGGPAPDATPDLLIRDAFSVALIADLNGDALGELVVGGRDRASFFFGSTRPDSLPDVEFAISGSAAASEATAAAVGDVDGDGVGDLALGFYREGTSSLPRGGVHLLRFRRYAVLEPNAATEWVAGAAAVVRWAGADSADVELSLDDGAHWSPFVAAGGGGGVVEVPDTLVERARVRVVTPAGLGLAAADTSQPFAIRSHVVLEPATSGTFHVGDTLSTRWLGSRLADVELVSTDGATPVRVASGVGGASEDSVRFVVPLVHSDSVLVRVRAAGDPAAVAHAGRSPGRIRVIPFVVLAPNGGEVWESGGTDTVRWLGATTADVQYSPDHGATWVTLASRAGGAPENALPVTMPQVSSLSALVRVVASGYSASPGHFDESDATFIVTEISRLVDLPTRRLFEFAASEANERTGLVVADAGDWNGDGFRDVAIGAPFARVGANAEAGRVTVRFGGPEPGALPDVVLEGPAASSLFGSAIAGGGDFDGDGFDDLVVGAWSYNNGRGSIFLYRGGLVPDATADQRFSVTASSGITRLGQSLAFVGDWDGDGRDDFVAGQRSNTNGTSEAPIYLGSARLDSLPDIKLRSPAVNDPSFATRVARAGDFDGDGWPDVWVTRVPTVNDTSGYAYLYRGGPGSDVFIDREIRGSRAYGFASYGLDGVGDVNGDGYDDLAVGVPYLDTGEVRIFLGGPGAVRGFTVHGRNSSDAFGLSVAGGGDINNDGFSDVLIGAVGYDAAGTDYGAAFAWYGFLVPDESLGLTFLGASNGQFGAATAVVPRFRDALLATMFVGAPYDSRVNNYAGSVAAYEIARPRLLEPRGGGTWIAGRPATVRWRGERAVTIELSLDDRRTWTVLATGAGGSAENEWTFTVPDAATLEARVRLTLDGYRALASTSETSTGTFRIAPDVPIPASAWSAATASEHGAALGTGARVAAIGDVSGDGHGDLLVLEDAAESRFAWLWLAGEAAARGPFLRTTPGAEVFAAPVGDWDGDGFGDFALGLPALEGTGVVRLYRGGADPDTAAFVTLRGAVPGSRFGAAIAGGDLDGDGASDLVVGAPGVRNSAIPGRVALFLGGEHADAIEDGALAIGVAGDEFGAALALPGDLNRDGCPEIAVGSPARDSLDATTGRVYLYCGAATGGAPQFTLTGERADDRFGAAVAAAGDVNGDGFNDLIVGAPGADVEAAPEPMRVDAGRVSLFFGGTNFDRTADWTITGAGAGAQLGGAIAGGVDTNGDGFADWLAGAEYSGGDERGGASLFQGGILPDTLADAAWDGAHPAARLGESLALVAEPGGFARVAIASPGASGAVAVREYASSRWWVSVADTAWPVGATRAVSWTGAERADVWLERADGTRVKLADDAGGAASNALEVTVPAGAGECRVVLTASASGVSGEAKSARVRLVSTVTLASFEAATSGAAEVRLAWATTPNVADGGVQFYRVYRRAPGMAAGERVADRVSANEVRLEEHARGATYTLAAVTAAGEEFVLGETATPAGPRGLVAYPVPARGDGVTIELTAATRGDGWTHADFAVRVYDVMGREVATLARGARATDLGVVRLTWPARVKAGLYFVRAETPSRGERLERRVVVVR